MEEDPFSGWGLRLVTLGDRNTFNTYFNSLAEPLSDYTFAQFYTWRNSLRILWKEIDGNLCVFANGAGDLTLLAPPIGPSRSDRALAECYELMDEYNAARGVPDRSRVEYVSAELLARFNPANLEVSPLGTDYIYDTQRMIDLAGGDLASKRQAKNRFMRNYSFRVESYDRVKHLGQCLNLLSQWKTHQDDNHREPNEIPGALKREKETLASELTLDAAEQLGLRGMVVYVGEPDSPERIRGFTFGEWLSSAQSSITVEKTDLSIKGLAQFIFSDFCAREWSGRPQVNVGDDWGLESLKWTKMSYRPVKLIDKYVVRRSRKILAAVPSDDVILRPARESDLAAAVELEQRSFTTHTLKKRQLQYLQQRDTTLFLVAEQSGELIGDGIALLRKHKTGISGRIYSLVVDQKHRNRGVGQRLLSALIDSLTQRGVRRIYLDVDQTNTTALQLYERIGFRRVGTLPDYYGVNRPAVHMMRQSPAAAKV